MQRFMERQLGPDALQIPVSASTKPVYRLDYHGEPESEKLPVCVSCDGPLEHVWATANGKLTCLDLSCGMYGREQRGK